MGASSGGVSIGAVGLTGLGRCTICGAGTVALGSTDDNDWKRETGIQPLIPMVVTQ